MVEHTPGPWLYTLTRDGSHYTVGEDGRGKPIHLANIAQVVGRNEVDARLIAAAPDLLAALETLTRLWETDNTGVAHYYQPWQSAMDAIAKARGTEVSA